jgi:hypothetical protein
VFLHLTGHRAEEADELEQLEARTEKEAVR